MMGAGTRYQRALGITDDADALFHDYMTLNHWDVEAGVARRLADFAGPTVEWLGDLGVEFYDQMVYGGDERVPRVHVPIGRGQAVINILHSACRRAGVEVALSQRVDRLLVEDGAVAGVAVAEDTITAGAVVLATGGFGSEPAKLAKYYPSAAATGWSWYIGAGGPAGTRSISPGRLAHRSSGTTAGSGFCTPTSRASTRRTCPAGSSSSTARDTGFSTRPRRTASPMGCCGGRVTWRTRCSTRPR
jgi:FAD binding domain